MARSLAGRDAGIICLILREEDENVFIADGRDRRVETPKKKNCKHVRLITGENGEPIRNAEPCMICRRLIKNAGIEKVINLEGEISSF